jgi:hypothetical protein
VYRRDGLRGTPALIQNEPRSLQTCEDRSHSIAFSAELAKEDILMFAIFNAYREP